MSRAKRVTFTDLELHKLKVLKDRKQMVVADPTRSGASFRKQASGATAFIYSCWQKNGVRFNTTLAAMTVAEARLEAAEFKARIKRGEDVRATLQAEKAEAKAETAAAKQAAYLETEAGRRKAEAEKRAALDAVFTVRKLIRRYDREHLSTRRASYATRAVRDMHRALADLLDVDANAITKAQVRERVDPASTVGTRRFLASVILAMFRHAGKHDWIANNPVRDYPMPPAHPPRKRTVTPQEARIIYSAAGALAYPEQQLFRLLMLTACRRGEIAGLRWDEVQEDDDGPVLLIPAERTKTGRISQTDHRVPLSSEAVRVIDSIERGGGRIVGSPYLFTRDGKQPITHFDRLKQRLDAEVKKLGDIPEFTTHDFRRSCVTALAGKGFDPIAIDLLLGHTPSGLREIARIYNRYEHKDTRRKALDAWAEMIAAPPATDNVRKLKRVAR